MMKEYSDEMLINKYFDHDLNDQEQAEFDQRLANDPMFRAMLNDYAETEGMLLKLAFHAKEEERKKFMEQYEAFLAEESVGEPPSHVAKEPIRRSFWQKNKMWMSVAASLFIGLALGIPIQFLSIIDFSRPSVNQSIQIADIPDSVGQYKDKIQMLQEDNKRIEIEKNQLLAEQNTLHNDEIIVLKKEKDEIFSKYYELAHSNIPINLSSEAETTASSGSKIEIFKPKNKSKNIYFSIFNHKESIEFVWKGKEFEILDTIDNPVVYEISSDNSIKKSIIKPGKLNKNNYYLWIVKDGDYFIKGVIYID